VHTRGVRGAEPPRYGTYIPLLGFLEDLILL
jgi:hypothetical protein